jgi:hypothetical protein
MDVWHTSVSSRQVNLKTPLSFPGEANTEAKRHHVPPSDVHRLGRFKLQSTASGSEVVLALECTLHEYALVTAPL